MKNSLKKALSLVALGAVAVSAASMSAFAEGEEASRFSADGGFSAEQIAGSAIKPTITATQELLTIETAKSNPQRKIELTVTGASAKYAATGFHIYYDERLSIETDPFGDAKVSRGPAAEYLTTKTPDVDPTAPKGMKGIFVCSSADKDRGLDGVVWLFNVTLPSDVAEGDVFPIDVLYKSNKTNEDLFVNVSKDEEGRLMQAYTFTQGIYNPTYNNNFKADKADVDKCEALANIKGEYDGYIAIADGEKPTEAPTDEPTEPPTKAPSEAPTEPPTKAPTTEAPTNAPTEPSTNAPTQGSTEAATNVTTQKATQAGISGSKTTSKKDNGGKTTTTGKKNDSPKTGVAGVGVAVAGLAVALGTAFVLRKKED